MARIRTIKPELPQSESLGRVSREARLLFIMLFTICDDAGRTRAASRLLASLLYPYDDDAPSMIPAWLDELERERCINRYEVDGAHYLEIPKWLEHQKIDRPSASKLPAPREPSPNPREPSSLDQGREGTKEGTGSGRDDAAAAAFAEWQSGAEGHGWRNADFLTSSRRFRLTAALSAYGGIDGWRRVLDKVSEAGFFLDENDQWQPWFSLDWLLDGDHIARLLEGAYVERRKPYATKVRHGSTHIGSADKMPTAEPWEQRMQGWRKSGQWLPMVWGPRPGETGCRVPRNLLGDA